MSKIEEFRYVIYSPGSSVLENVKGRFGIMSEDGKMRIGAEELLMDRFGPFGVLCRKKDEAFEKVKQIWANGGVMVGIYQSSEPLKNKGTYPLVTLLANIVERNYPNKFDYAFVTNSPENLKLRLAWDNFGSSRVNFYDLPLTSHNVASMITLIR